MKAPQFKSFLFCFTAVTVFACNSPQNRAVENPQQKAVKPAIMKEEDQVVSLIMNLDEVKRKSAMVLKQSKGKRHLATYVETPPTAADPYYWVKVAEDNGGSYVTYYSFEVQAKTHAIKYYDAMQDSLISLSQWRKTTTPDER
jgi:hypothetical protein